MYRVWYILAAICLGLAAGGGIDQVVRCHAVWDWSQLLHHETFIAIGACVGIALLVVAIFDYLGRE